MSGYVDEVRARIADQLSTLPSQPIVFAGSGLSRRWFGSPSWIELLEECVKACPHIDRELAYFIQDSSGLDEVASKIARSFREWAWGEGRNNFPAELFQAGVHPQAYLKYFIASKIKSIDCKLDVLSGKNADEAKLLAAIRPHCVITTNYDLILEELFPDYSVAFSGDVISSAFSSIGEIVKIHGCVSDVQSIVFTREDYDAFSRKRKYISAKLTTYFNEHVVLFVGYSAQDPNIAGILSDIDEALSTPGDLIKNIFFLERLPEGVAQPASEKLIQISADKSVRVNLIQTDDFDWVFEAFAHKAPIENFNPKLMRAILSRAYELVRVDIPNQQLKVDFDLISSTVQSEENFAKLFGIASINTASEMSVRYPHSLTDVGVMLGGKGWHTAQKMIDKIKEEVGFDIKCSDNRYHMRIKVGKTQFGKYSQEAVILLQSVATGAAYSVDP